MSPEHRWSANARLLHGYSSSTSSEDSLPHPLDEKPRRCHRGRRVVFAIGVSLLVFSTLGLLYSRLNGSEQAQYVPEQQLVPGADPIPLVDLNSTVPELLEPILEESPDTPVEHDPYDSTLFLNGPPTMRFRDNLRPDRKYISSWISAGWTNDVMTYINLIYLGIITDRIPIIPMFSPSHVGFSVTPIPFGEVFDVPRLQKSLQRPILEWWQVKYTESTEVEDLGCWNTWEAVQSNEHYPRRSVTPSQLSLDISYTTAPSWIKLIPNFQHDLHSTFWSLAVLGFPEGRRDNLIPPQESPLHKALLPPDEQLLCYDYLYYVCAQQPFEFNFDYSPAWRFVGQYMRWSPQLESLINQYARRTIGVPDDEPTPNWIAVHVRHGDFKNLCADVPLSDCFAPLSVIAKRVQEVKEELLGRMGIVVENVIMTSDENDEAWWDGVRSRGWFQVDHSETVQLYGPWYPVLIDAGIQSSGVGFVGTDRSTMSILAKRRVESWRDGAVRMVKWGRPGADDH